MIVRLLRSGLLVLLAFCCTSSAQANWVADFLNGVVRDTKRRQCWPKPFDCPDRQAVRAPFATMVENGWLAQNTLGPHHFEQGTGRLTESGRLKVRWIATQVPEHRRCVLVEQGLSEEETTARVQAVQEVLSRIAGADQLPVMTTTRPAPTFPAYHVDLIGRKYVDTIPPPKLPSNEHGSGGRQWQTHSSGSSKTGGQ